MTGVIDSIYLASEAGAPVRSVPEVTAMPGLGLQGDRYLLGTGHWSRFGRVCEVTFIALEDLEVIERETGVAVLSGQHRRNIVTRGVPHRELQGQRFQVGEAVFEYRGPRSICRYIERVTQPGMTDALRGRAGFCARVVQGGIIRPGDQFTLIPRERNGRPPDSALHGSDGGTV